MRTLTIPALVSVTLLAGLVGCGTSSAPRWTIDGAGALDAGQFYGTGQAGPEISDMSLRREAADNRARADLQRVFDTYSQSLMRDYTGDEGVLVERAIQTYAAGHLSGASVVQRHQAKDGTVHSLVQLDFATLADQLAQIEELSGSKRQALRTRAEELFREMERVDTMVNDQ